jgi:hypothetical protein
LSVGGTDTFSYATTSGDVVRIVNTLSGTTDSIVDTMGDRLGNKVGTTLNWLVPDLRGTVGPVLSGSALSAPRTRAGRRAAQADA